MQIQLFRPSSIRISSPFLRTNPDVFHSSPSLLSSPFLRSSPAAKLMQIPLLHSSPTLLSSPFLGSSHTASGTQRMSFLVEAARRDNLYKLLSVAEIASPAEIKEAYWRLARKWHPDVCPTSEDKSYYAEQFMKIKQAYEVLSDTVLRATYDLILKSVPIGGEGFSKIPPVGEKGRCGLGDLVSQVERLSQQTAGQGGLGDWNPQLEGLQQRSASRARRRAACELWEQEERGAS